MGSWNWRLYKEIVKDDKGHEVEKLSFKEIWYDDNDKPNGIGDCVVDIDQYGELAVPDYSGPIDERPPLDLNSLGYLPLDLNEAKSNIKFTLNKLLEALDKPVLTKDDFTSHDSGTVEAFDDEAFARAYGFAESPVMQEGSLYLIHSKTDKRLFDAYLFKRRFVGNDRWKDAAAYIKEFMQRLQVDESKKLKTSEEIAKIQEI